MFNKLCKLNSKFENYQSKAPEWGAFLIYVISHIVLCIYHEPWYDECVAWMISKYTSVKDIIFYVPHYEGHPPLWHLILKLFATFNMDFHVALSLLVILFSSAAVYLILFFSPFRRIIKLVFPFTYFIFYQYGVISRPYCMMMLAFCLLAVFYKNKNEKPVRYIATLAFLCMTSAYGIVLAGGISAVWMIEVVREYWTTDGKSIIKEKIIADKRILGMLLLFVLALLIIFEIMPNKGNYAVENVCLSGSNEEAINKIIYCLLCNVPDSFCYDVFKSFGIDFAIVAMVGCVVLLVIFFYGIKKRTALLFFIPYILYELFASLVYMLLHHTGVVQLFLIFWIWISVEKQCTENDNKYNHIILDKRLAVIGKAAVIYALLISVYYSSRSSVCDIKRPYSEGKNVANFIEMNHLEDYKIMGEWLVNDKVTSINISDVYAMLPYLEDNIFSYGEYGMDGKYSLHVTLSEAETEAEFSRWREIGEPDIIIGEVPFYDVFVGSDTKFTQDYRYIYSDIGEMAWKDTSSQSALGVYMRTDLADELGFEAIPKPMIVNINR